MAMARRRTIDRNCKGRWHEKGAQKEILSGLEGAAMRQTDLDYQEE